MQADESIQLDESMEKQRKRAMAMDNTCFEKAKARGQQTFTVVEQDQSAPFVILEWIRLNFNTCPPDKLKDAFMDALAMRFSATPKKCAD